MSGSESGAPRRYLSFPFSRISNPALPCLHSLVYTAVPSQVLRVSGMRGSNGPELILVVDSPTCLCEERHAPMDTNHEGDVTVPSTPILAPVYVVRPPAAGSPLESPNAAIPLPLTRLALLDNRYPCLARLLAGLPISKPSTTLSLVRLDACAL